MPSRAIVLVQQRKPVAYAKCSAPATPPNSNIPAIFSPSAPQVEYNMLDNMTCKTEGAQDLHAPKGREPDQEPNTRCETRGITRSKLPNSAQNYAHNILFASASRDAELQRHLSHGTVNCVVANNDTIQALVVTHSLCYCRFKPDQAYCCPPLFSEKYTTLFSKTILGLEFRV